MSVKRGRGLGLFQGMVLISDATGNGKWVDLASDHSTLEGLTERLREGVDQHHWFAWRIVVIESEGGPVLHRRRVG